VVWEDRNKLDKNQQAFWQAQVKGYRAHVKESIEAERKTAIDVYNHSMKTFDNNVKEDEAAQKLVREKEKDWLVQTKDVRAEQRDVRTTARTEQKDTEKRVSDLQKTQRDILKRQATILKDTKDPLSGQERPLSDEAAIEFEALTDQRKLAAGELDKILMATNPEYRAKRTEELNKPAVAPAPVEPKAAPSPAAATVKQELPASDLHGGGDADIPHASSATPVAAPKYKPHPNGKPLEVRRGKDGRLMGKFEDGSIAWLDEVQ
jgi:hypothetical protein